MARARSNGHHLAWERRKYTTDLERNFRELPCLKVQIDIEVHVLLHRLYLPPRKPTDEQMERLIQRHTQKHCACYSGNSAQQNILDL